MSRYQRGHVYEAFSAFHVQYYQSEIKDGKTIRVRRTHRLCAKDRVHYSATSKAVQKLCAEFMTTVNEDVVVGEDMPITDFWTKYLHYCEHEYKGRGTKPSTVRGFKRSGISSSRYTSAIAHSTSTRPIKRAFSLRASRRRR